MDISFFFSVPAAFAQWNLMKPSVLSLATYENNDIQSSRELRGQWQALNLTSKQHGHLYFPFVHFLANQQNTQKERPSHCKSGGFGIVEVIC